MDFVLPILEIHYCFLNQSTTCMMHDKAGIPCIGTLKVSHLLPWFSLIDSIEFEICFDSPLGAQSHIFAGCFCDTLECNNIVPRIATFHSHSYLLKMVLVVSMWYFGLFRLKQHTLQSETQCFPTPYVCLIHSLWVPLVFHLIKDC